MSFQSRKQKILKIIEESGEVDVKELAKNLQTSEITIRRDLSLLASDGLVFRTHGGAMKVSLLDSPVSFANKSAVNADKKDFICRIAAREIEDGEVIFMDCGSTAFRMCQFIKNKKIKVITNSLPVVYELFNTEVSINLVGGEVDAGRLAIHGSIAVDHIKRYKADKAFIGVDGISAENGLSAMSEKEAEITMAIAEQSDKTYLLCDSTKLGKDKYLQFSSLKLIDILISDATDEVLAGFRQKGVNCINKA